MLLVRVAYNGDTRGTGEGSEMTKMVNLTPHTLDLLVHDGNGQQVGWVDFHCGRTRPSRFRFADRLVSDGVARATTTIRLTDEFVWVGGEKFLISRTTFGAPVGLPDPVFDTVYVVSLATAQGAATAGRTTADLLVVGETVRDEDGRVIGCTGFDRV